MSLVVKVRKPIKSACLFLRRSNFTLSELDESNGIEDARFVLPTPGRIVTSTAVKYAG